MVMRNLKWERDEIILALNLYFSIDKEKYEDYKAELEEMQYQLS